MLDTLVYILHLPPNRCSSFPLSVFIALNNILLTVSPPFLSSVSLLRGLSLLNKSFLKKFRYFFYGEIRILLSQSRIRWKRKRSKSSKRGKQREEWNAVIAPDIFLYSLNKKSFAACKSANVLGVCFLFVCWKSAEQVFVAVLALYSYILVELSYCSRYVGLEKLSSWEWVTTKFESLSDFSWTRPHQKLYLAALLTY